jgi:pimeloyl-ACP methyl ester carboxylesterase/DNA-binding CsgD family transcriptional regulator
MPMSRSQEIRYCTTADGLRIAMATMGSGPPVVCTTAWLSHLEHDLASPWNGSTLQALAPYFRVIRYDGRGNGLSQRDISSLGIEEWVRDLEAVVDALDLRTFALYGVSQGAPVAVAYAARHPDRIDRLVLQSGCARGLLRRNPPENVVTTARMTLEIAEAGWSLDSSSFRRLFLDRVVRTATKEQLSAMDQMQRVAVSGSVVRMFLAAAYELDVSSEAPKVRCPTLIAHADQDPCFPFSESALLASLIEKSKLITLRTTNHALVPGDPSLSYLMSEAIPFLQGGTCARELTTRQIQVLQEVARGKTDKQIARDLGLSPRTVEMHVARAIDALGSRTRTEAVHQALSRGLIH